MKRHRTLFGGQSDFDGWWVKSPSGTVAQLVNAGRNLHTDHIYRLKFEGNNQQGNGAWTTEALMETGATIRRLKEDLP